MFQFCVFLPIFNVDFTESADDQLEFSFVERTQQMLRDELIETLKMIVSKIIIFATKIKDRRCV